MRLYLFLEDTSFIEVGEHARIGRWSGCELVVPSGKVARVHAEVTRTPDGWVMADTNSSRTFLVPSMQRVKRHLIVNGDRFMLNTEVVTARLIPEPLQSEVLLEDDVAAHPNDMARRAVWVDALIERGDPLGAWLQQPRDPPPLHLDPGMGQLAWEDGLIRTMILRELSVAGSVIHSRLASHLLELIVDAPESPEAAQRAFTERLVRTRLPALRLVRLRHFTVLPKSLPLAPRLISLLP